VDPEGSRPLWGKGGFAALITGTLLALVPTTAGAATICVGVAGAGCNTTVAGVQAALDAAKASSANDEVVIGAGRFEGPFSYLPFTDSGTLKISGQGDETVLTAPGPTSSAITVLELGKDSAGHVADVADLAVHAPTNTAGLNPGNVGIRAAGAVDRVHVVFDANDASANAPAGVVLSTSGAVVRNSDIELPATNNFGTGVLVQGLNLAVAPLVADSHILAPIGVAAAPQALTVVRSRILSSIRGVEACNGPVTIEDSLIRVTGSSGVGLEAEGGARCGSIPSSVTARQLTIVGNGAAGQVGVLVRVGVAGQTPVADLSLSIVRHLVTAFQTQTVTPGVATIRVGASDFEASRHFESSGGGGTAVFEQPQPNIDADPLFQDELAGVFSLLPGSPAIDSSFSPPLAPGESPTDIEGNPRVLDGNGDGVAARDMGAFESPAVPPPPTAAGAATVIVDKTPPDTKISRGPKQTLKVSGHRRAAVSFSFESTEAGSSFQCELDKGAFSFCRSPTKERLKVGTHVFRVRAIDAAGNVDRTPATQRIKVVRKKAIHRRPHRHS
jgi:hypothetical protein